MIVIYLTRRHHNVNDRVALAVDKSNVATDHHRTTVFCKLGWNTCLFKIPDPLSCVPTVNIPRTLRTSLDGSDIGQTMVEPPQSPAPPSNLTEQSPVFDNRGRRHILAVETPRHSKICSIFPTWKRRRSLKYSVLANNPNFLPCVTVVKSNHY